MNSERWSSDPRSGRLVARTNFSAMRAMWSATGTARTNSCVRKTSLASNTGSMSKRSVYQRWLGRTALSRRERLTERDNVHAPQIPLGKRDLLHDPYCQFVWLVTRPTRFPRTRCRESESSTSTPARTVVAACASAPTEASPSGTAQAQRVEARNRAGIQDCDVFREPVPSRPSAPRWRVRASLVRVMRQAVGSRLTPSTTS